ncbi:MAG: beta-ketoacyl synthase N-terminal-like domain-containing protein, partial [Ardenticatenaceae bacterium]
MSEPSNQSSPSVDIAIIGMASLFPEARTLAEYWDNIVKKIDCIIDVPTSRWSLDDYYDPDPRTPDKTYCKLGGFIPDVEFDPLEFGLPPNILEVTDVSQLLSLVVAKEALADAGYLDAEASVRERIGVILGVGGARPLISSLASRLQYPIWKKVLKNSGLSDEDTEKVVEKMKLAYVRWEENTFPGMLGNVVTGRIANRLDLGSINCTVDAACASSLSALQMAVSELVAGRSDVIISGGVDTDNTVFTYLCFSKTPAFSRSDVLRPFDAESDGMMIGEGIGMVVLKRLSDAERDGDRIYALIKGIGSSSDGRYKSIYAPRSEGQERALIRAYENAGVPVESVDLIEAHGTGTAAGDLCEVTTLNRFFRDHTDAMQQIALGSVKSQIGHTKSTAGAASLVKIALALYHKVLPPTINVTNPHPKMEIEKSPLYLNTETRPWIRAAGDSPRRAGVSSFGFGGTNFHTVLEEYEADHQGAYRMNRVPQPIVLVADGPQELLTGCQEALRQLEQKEDQGFADLVSASPTAVAQSAARVGFVAQSAEEASAFLVSAISMLKSKPDEEAWQHPKGIHYRRSGIDSDTKVVALFPGQGAQYLNMGREIGINFPLLREGYGALDELFVADGQTPLSKVLFPPPAWSAEESGAQSDALRSTEYAQPAIGVFSFALYKMLQEAGFEPDFVAGHSFGELSALWAAGVLSDEAYHTLIRARGKAMAPPADPDFDAGGMLAVTGDLSKLADDVAELADVKVANWNSHQQAVVAGPKASLPQAEKALKEKGYHVVFLPVSAAFHTPLVGHAQKPFAEAIHSVTFNPPTIPVYSNATGQAYPNEPSEIQAMLAEHILQSVQFSSEIENMYAAGGTVFVEIGPRSILTNLVKKILGDRPHLTVALNPSRKKDSDRQLRDGVLQLRVAGLSLASIDPYQEQPKPVDEKAGKKKLSVMLNGANYVSAKTKSAFEKALQDGHRISMPALNGTNGHNGHNAPAVAPVPVVSQATYTPANGPAKAKTFAIQSPQPIRTPSPATGALSANRQLPAPAAVLPPMPAAAAPSMASATISNTKNATNGPARATRAVMRPMPAAASASSSRTATLRQAQGTANGSATAPRAVMPAAKAPMPTQAAPKAPIVAKSPISSKQAPPKPQKEASRALSARQSKEATPLAAAAPSANSQALSAPAAADVHRLLDTLERSLEHLSTHQSETYRTHEQYLGMEKQYANTFFKLMEQQQSLLLNRTTAPPPRVLESLGKSMKLFHTHQSETLRAHELYLSQQVQYSGSFFKLVQAALAAAKPRLTGRVANVATITTSAKVIEEPTTDAPASHLQTQPSPLLPTPAPANMPAPSARLAARAPQAAPSAPPAPAPAVARAQPPAASVSPAPARVVAPAQTYSPAPVAAPAPVVSSLSKPVTAAPAAAPAPVAAPVARAATSGVNVAELTNALLEVVSDKT